VNLDTLAYEIKLDVFAGPFDLLLDLILKQEVDIYEVPIAKITDDYLKYVTKMKELNLDLTSEFLVIAATLLELKSYALLPVDEAEQIAQIRGEMETRETLIDHLIEYMTFQGVAANLTGRAEEQSYHYPRVAAPEEEFAGLAPDFLQGVRLTDLTSLAQELLQVKPTFEVDTSHIAIYNLSIGEKAIDLVKALKRKETRSFRELCGKAETRIEKIIVFLAILELFKRGVIGVSQAKTFGDIQVKLVDEAAMTANQWSED
jgi:segregation and condensation protein A